MEIEEKATKILEQCNGFLCLQPSQTATYEYSLDAKRIGDIYISTLKEFEEDQPDIKKINDLYQELQEIFLKWHIEDIEKRQEQEQKEDQDYETEQEQEKNNQKDDFQR